MNKPIAGQSAAMPDTTAQPTEMPSTEVQSTEVLAGSIERVTFLSADSGAGRIDAIDAENRELSVLYPTSEAKGIGSQVVDYGWGELDHLVPAYACKIHNSQAIHHAHRD
jgi:hypothetical protein